MRARDALGARGSDWRPVLAFLILTLLLLLGLMLIHRWLNAREDFMAQLRMLASVVGNNAGAALIFNDADGGEEILAALEYSPAVFEGVLLRPDGRVLADWRSAKHTAEVDRQEMVMVRVPAFFRDRPVGSVLLRARADALRDDLIGFIAGFVLMSLTAMALAVPVSLGLRRRMMTTEALFDGFFDASPFGMAILDDRGRFVRVNQTLAGLNGYAAREHLGRLLSERVSAEPERWQLAHQRALTGETTVEEWRLILSSEPYCFLALFFPIRGAGGKTAACGIVTIDITERKRYQAEVEHSRQVLRQFALHRERLIDAEHKRLAIEVHDQLGQILTTALMRIRLLLRELPAVKSQLREHAVEIEALLREAQSGVRDVTTRLRPAVLGFGLGPALEWLVDRLFEGSELVCHLELPAQLPELDEERALACFRIAQEALTNCLRHSAAHQVWVTVVVSDDQLHLTVRDDGRGLVDQLAGQADGQWHFGLVGMQERAAGLGGRLSLVGPPGAGVKVELVLPLSQPAEGEKAA